MASVLSKASGAVAACARRVSRAARRLLRARRRSLGSQAVPAVESGGSGAGGRDGGEGVWRRAILMGERCEPLSFSGAIHYDSLGRPMAQPRRGKAALLCRSSDAVDHAVVTVTKKGRYPALLEN